MRRLMEPRRLRLDKPVSGFKVGQGETLNSMSQPVSSGRGAEAWQRR
jgi:hypothetical protein